MPGLGCPIDKIFELLGTVTKSPNVIITVTNHKVSIPDRKINTYDVTKRGRTFDRPTSKNDNDRQVTTYNLYGGSMYYLHIDTNYGYNIYDIKLTDNAKTPTLYIALKINFLPYSL